MFVRAFADVVLFELLIKVESISYTDMNEGMWFSYILGPDADGIFEEICGLYSRFPEP